MKTQSFDTRDLNRIDFTLPASFAPRIRKAAAVSDLTPGRFIAAAVKHFLAKSERIASRRHVRHAA